MISMQRLHLCLIVGIRRPNTPLRKMQIDELKSFKKIDALVFHSPVDGEGDWQSNSDLDEKRFRKYSRYTNGSIPLVILEKILLLMVKNVELKIR